MTTDNVPGLGTQSWQRRGDGKRVRPAAGRTVKSTVVNILLVVMLFPVAWLVASSFSPADGVPGPVEPFTGPFTFDNYARGWSALPTSFGRFLFNSTVIAVVAVIGNIISCTMAGYAFARLEFQGRRLLFATMLATIMIPMHVMIIPQYVIFNELGWVNTFLPLVVPKFLAVDAFFIFLTVQFIRGLPRDLDAAAALDGCGPIQTFYRVILPLCFPAIATTAVFTFVWTWNDFFSQLIYLSSPDNYTVPLGLQAFVDVTTQSSYGALFAMSVVSLGPILGFFIAFQRYLVYGIASTGMK